jgi:hypothetical protein
MKTIALYRQFSRECAQLADQVANRSAKQSLQSMSRVWEKLADERAAYLTREIDRHSGLTAASMAPAQAATPARTAITASLMLPSRAAW